MTEEPMKCPRCSGQEFSEHNCGQDDWDGPAWTAYSCKDCLLWYSGWTSKWLVDVTSWRDEEDAEEFKAAQ